MEVEESPGPSIEGSAFALPQLRERTQFRQKRLEAIKVLGRRMPHPSSMTRARMRTQEEPPMTSPLRAIGQARPDVVSVATVACELRAVTAYAIVRTKSTSRLRMNKLLVGLA